MIDRTTHEGVTILAMRRNPANVLDAEFSDAIETAIRTEGARDDTDAIVLTGSEGVFSAGVDLFRLLDGGAEYLQAFLEALDRLFATASETDKPLVAAVNGHAIAGGGVLALACDYRVMIDGSARIGLPELRVGVPFPNSALTIIRAAVPRQHLREVIMLGRNFDPAAALERGLIDEKVPADEVEDRSVAIARELASVPARSFKLTKRLMGLPPGADSRALDAEVYETWADPEIHDHIRGYLEATLGKRSR